METSPIFFWRWRSIASRVIVLVDTVAMLPAYFTSWLEGLPRFEDLESSRSFFAYKHALAARRQAGDPTAQINARRAPSGAPTLDCRMSMRLR
jgi:hypothetical protein